MQTREKMLASRRPSPHDYRLSGATALEDIDLHNVSSMPIISGQNSFVVGPTFLRHRAARRMRRQADAARDNRDYMKAALAYEKVLSHVPDDAGIHVQCGHMFKEAGELERAEQHYNKARLLMPNDPDLALQFGHFYKMAGRLDEAERSYRRAAELMPGAAEPVDELAGLFRSRRSNSGEDGSQRFTASSPREPNRAGSGGRRHARTNPAASQAAARKTLHLIRRAGEACASKNYRAAAVLYEKALEVAPNDSAHHLKCAQLFESAGDLTPAAHHYREAWLLAPDDPDIALQSGYFHRTCGQLREAELAFKKAGELDPDWPEPAEQLEELYGKGWRNRHKGDAVRPNGTNAAPYSLSSPAEPIAVDGDGSLNGFSLNRLLSPELAPRAPESQLHPYSEQIEIRQLGRRQRTDWGLRPTLRGVEAIRGFCVSANPVTDLRVSLNGLAFHREGPLKGYPLKYESHDQNKRKYGFNIWYDFSQFVNGLYDVELQFTFGHGSVRTYRDVVVVAEPLPVEEYPNSDGLVVVSPNDDRPLNEQINTQPSMIREAGRAVLSTPPQTVLVVRADQLGDMVTSIPAIRRLRELLPSAYLVGLVSVVNAELAESLHLFDDVIAIEFTDDEWERRRVLPLDKQYELQQRLSRFKFDVAIDLSMAADSRQLLVLSGAPYVIGFKDDRSPWLSAFIEVSAQDPINGFCELSHSGMTATLVEFFGVLLGNRAQIIRRDDLTRDRLAAYGLAGSDEFTVLHTGARLKFSQWPHYDTLASMIIEKTDLKVVMMTDDPAKHTKLPRRLMRSDRFQLLDKRLPFDDFDALLSFCTVFVGNDSGPSHLASLRGANVVNLYMARHNWNEWGHEAKGYIITRRVPCAGCNIHHDPEECGREFACIRNISPDEVFRTVMKFV
jgi:ADP-heptose:LPS heptosyltransferase/Tfp pilus assembly protein PilF